MKCCILRYGRLLLVMIRYQYFNFDMILIRYFAKYRDIDILKMISM